MYFCAFHLSTSQSMLFPASPIITPATLQKEVTGDCPIGVSSSSFSPRDWWGRSVYKVSVKAEALGKPPAWTQADVLPGSVGACCACAWAQSQPALEYILAVPVSWTPLLRLSGLHCTTSRAGSKQLLLSLKSVATKES